MICVCFQIKIVLKFGGEISKHNEKNSHSDYRIFKLLETSLNAPLPSLLTDYFFLQPKEEA